VIGLGDARREVMAAVVADQIGDRRAGDGGGERVGVRRHERRVEAAPRVADHADLLRIDGAHRATAATAGRTHSTTDRPGLARAEDDVGLELEVAGAGERRHVVVLALDGALYWCSESERFS
jgi:hypothetical protein